jgi:3D (Asp-Asp-Asp) domain-containing protein
VLWALRALVGCTGLVSSAVLALGLARDVVTSVGDDGRVPQPAACATPVSASTSAAEPETGMPPPDSVAARRGPKPRGHLPATLHRTYRVTAYSDWGVTASGKQVGVGQCAAPVDIPFGAKVYIPALGREFVVTDRTNRRFRHNTVDLFMPGDRNCREFGRRYLECEIRLPPTTARHPARG